MSIKNLLAQFNAYARITSKNTHFTTSYATNFTTAVNSSRTTSHLTSHVTAVPKPIPVYTLATITAYTPGTGWNAGDLANVYFTGSFAAVAPGYGQRVILITAVEYPGGPIAGHAVHNVGGYYSTDGAPINLCSGYMQSAGGGYATFSGGVAAPIGSFSSTTSAVTSYTTAYNTAEATSRTTSRTTDKITTFSTNSAHPTAQVANILVIGQSNSANYGSPTDSYQPINNVVRLASNGIWTRADSPSYSLASGSGGNLEGRIGDALINQSSINQVRILNVSVGGTRLGWWRSDALTDAYAKRPDDSFVYANGRLYERLTYAAQIAQNENFSFTHVLVCIGESDGLAGTTTAQYKDDFLKVQSDLIALGIEAPIFLSRTSYGGTESYPQIVQAQSELINESSQIYAGPHTDSYVGPVYRWDGLHFSVAGLDAVGALWATSIAAPQETV